MLFRQAVFMHVTPGPKGKVGRLPVKAVRLLEGQLGRIEVVKGVRPGGPCAPVDAEIGYHHRGLAGLDGQRRQLGRCHDAAAAIRHRGVEAPRHAELAGDVLVRHGGRHDDAIGDDAIDLVRLDTGVVQRRQDGVNDQLAQILVGAPHGRRLAYADDCDVLSHAAVL